MNEQVRPVMLEQVSQAAKQPKPPLLSRRYALEIRQQLAWHWQAVIIGLALLLGLGISAAILVTAGVPAGELLNEFVVLTVFDAQSLKAVLFQASPMILVGLAGCMAFRAKFWNLGLEGQMIWGAIGATAISLFEVGPPALRLPLMLAAAIGCGLAWALAPVVLKLRLKVNEIISTLMLNYLAINFLLHLLYGSWKDRGARSLFAAVPAVRTLARTVRWHQRGGATGGGRRAAGAVVSRHLPRRAVPALCRCQPAGGRRGGRAGAEDDHRHGADFRRHGRDRRIPRHRGAGGAADAVVLSGLRLLRHPHRLSRPQQPGGGTGGGAADGDAVRCRTQPAGVLPDPLFHGAAGPGDPGDLRRLLGFLYPPPHPPRSGGES